MSSDSTNNLSMVEMSASPRSDGPPADEDTPYSNMTELETHEDHGHRTIHFQPGSGKKLDKEEKFSTPLNTIIVATCNIIGGGVLALPSGFAESSLIFGIFLLIGNASLTFMNLYFIVSVSEKLKTYHYGTVLQKGLGNRGALITNVCLTIFPLGACISYARVIGDSMPPVLENFFGAAPGTFITSPGGWIFISAFVFFALSCRRNLSEMFIVAISGLITIAFAILCVVIRFFDGKYSETGQPASVEPGFRPFYITINFFKTIPLITFSLSVHNNAPVYYEELEERSVPKMMRVFGCVHVIVVTSYLICAMFGLLTFGESHIGCAHGNILDAYSHYDVLLNVCRLLMFFHFVAVFPILQMATRKGFNNLVFGSKWLPMRTIVIETAGIVVVSCLVGFLVPNIDDVLAINGAVAGSVVILMAPSFLYLRVIGPDTEGWTKDKFKIAAACSIAYGVVVMFLGCIVSIMEIVQRSDSKLDCEFGDQDKNSTAPLVNITGLNMKMIVDTILGGVN